MSKLNKNLWFLIVLCFVSPLSADSQLRLATTTSTYNSGLLDNLLPIFEQKTGVRVQVISVGTGAALRLAQDGDVDLVITHAPEAEEAFIQSGHGVMPQPLMYNNYIIVGPKEDPAALISAKSLSEALSLIVTQQQIFVSRGDNSGTHIKELQLWENAGQVIPFKGYRSVGQGMGRVLSLADEMEAYTLTDRGTWLAMKSRLDSVVVFEGDEQLYNPYQVILVNPDHHHHVRYDAAKALQDWLVSDEGQGFINNFTIEGEPLFYGTAIKQKATFQLEGNP